MFCKLTHKPFVFFITGVGFDGQGGQLPTSRVKRKRQQLENIMAFVVPFLQPCDNLSSSSVSANKKKVVVDFCCGYDVFNYCPLWWCIIGLLCRKRKTKCYLFMFIACVLSSCGHQSIPLAFLFPEVTFILIDTNIRYVNFCQKRVLKCVSSTVHLNLLLICFVLCFLCVNYAFLCYRSLDIARGRVHRYVTVTTIHIFDSNF